MKRSDYVKIYIGLKALFRKNLTSMVLVLMFIFYNFFIFYIEIFLFQSTYDKIEYLCVIPIMYMIINYIMNSLKSTFNNLNKFFIIGLFSMLIISIIQIGLSYSKTNIKEYLILIFLIAQMIIFQKLLFIQIIIFLLKVFDISSIRLRNQMNSKSFNSRSYEQNTNHCQRNFHDFYNDL